jgi:membrane protein
MTLHRDGVRRQTDPSHSRSEGRPLPDEAPEPQPEHEEPRLADPSPRELSKRDYVAIVKRAVRKSLDDHITNLAAALAYYAFLALPAALMVALGLFSVLADPSAIQTLVDKLGSVMPGQAAELIDDSLRRMSENSGSGLAVIGVGLVVALWSLTSAMQNLMWALNVAYDRDESRGFLRRRMVALAMLTFAFLGLLLMVGVLILGPHLSRWFGESLGAESVVRWAWLAGQWPLLIAGLVLVFAGLLYFGPNIEHPRWSFLTFGSGLAVIAWLAVSGAFAVYASMFGSYNKAWGSLSAVVVLLTWLWLSNLALLFGAELNAEAERSRELRRGEPAEEELQAPTKA